MAASSVSRRKAKKLRLFSFWEEADVIGSPWLRRAWQRSTSRTKTRSDLEIFRGELDRNGVKVSGLTFCNCEMTGGNDISLIYPWVHISNDSIEINTWIDSEVKNRNEVTSPTNSRYQSQELSPSFSSRIQGEGGRRLVQGSYCIVETLVPSQEVYTAGEQLVVLLGFRTTDDNCVDTLEADEERSEEARSWRDWTGIGNLYSGLARLSSVQVNKIEFLESHVPDHTAVFHYLVLLYLQVESEAGRIAVLDAVARFRVRHMSGYVTLYTCLGNQSEPKDNIYRKVAEDKLQLEQARKDFLKN